MPYSTAALTGALGGREPDSFASAETAAAMAQEAYRSAAEFAALGADFVGVACTAALVTDRPKKGEHKVRVSYLCWMIGSQMHLRQGLGRLGSTDFRKSRTSALSLLLCRCSTASAAGVQWWTGLICTCCVVCSLCGCAPASYVMTYVATGFM